MMFGLILFAESCREGNLFIGPAKSVIRKTRQFIPLQDISKKSGILLFLNDSVPRTMNEKKDLTILE